MQEKNETQLMNDLGVLINNQSIMVDRMDALSEKLARMTNNQVVLAERLIDINTNLTAIKRLLDPDYR